MTRRHWKSMFAALASLACTGYIGLSVWPTLPGITRANFARIELGMTQAQTEAILGGPPSDIAPGGRTWVGLHFL